MQFTFKRWPEILGLTLLTSSVLGSYEVARPAAESLFLQAYGKDALPMAWLGVALTAGGVVFLYNRYAARMRLLRLFAVCIAVTMGLLCALQFALRSGIPFAPFALYLWKDVYIVLLVEIFWSFANMIYPLKDARWLYGLFCASGSVGSGLSTRGLRWFVSTYSTPTYDATTDGLWLVLPLLSLSLLSLLLLAKSDAARRANEMLHLSMAPKPQPAENDCDPPEPKPSTPEAKADRTGLRALLHSPYLMWIVGMVLAMQLLSSLVDYRFNDLVSAQYEGAARTAAISSVYEWISYGALAMQLLSGLLLKVLGLTSCLLSLPLVAIGGAVAMALWPIFMVGAVSKAVGKILDYSLARSTKEILYLPLSYEEKTQGKALCDMLGYRLAKGLTALVLQALIWAGLAGYSMWIAACCGVGWLFCAIVCDRRYRVRVGSKT